MKANDYKFLSGTSNVLEKKVQQALRHGWRLYKRPYSDNSGNHFQAMIIPTTDKDYEDNSRPLM